MESQTPEPRMLSQQAEEGRCREMTNAIPSICMESTRRLPPSHRRASGRPPSRHPSATKPGLFLLEAATSLPAQYLRTTKGRSCSFSVFAQRGTTRTAHAVTPVPSHRPRTGQLSGQPRRSVDPFPLVSLSEMAKKWRFILWMMRQADATLPQNFNFECPIAPGPLSG